MKELSEAPKIVEFLQNRGLDVAHATSCGVKALDDTRIAYPLWNGQWKYRDVLTKQMGVAKMGSTEKPMPAVFGQMHQTLGTDDFHIHLCEGETDALALSQVLRDNLLEGVAVAVPGVDGIVHALSLLEPMLGSNIHITMYPDRDEAGERLASAASRLGAHVVQLPTGQDLCSYLGSLETRHRWGALQTLRYYAATYVPFQAPEKPRATSPLKYRGDVPIGVLHYFQRIVGEVVGEENIGFNEVEKVCCPWHTDPMPSLSIDWNRAIWFCHGCREGGGVKKWKELLAEGRHR